MTTKIKAAIKHHSGQFQDEFQLLAALKESSDFTEEEMMQIAQNCEYKEAPAAKSPKLKSGKNEYQIWQVLRNNPQVNEDTDETVVTFDKLKLIKERVLITDEQAAVLNEGRYEDAGNRVFEVYLRRNEKLPRLVTPGAPRLKPVVKKATLQH